MLSTTAARRRDSGPRCSCSCLAVACRVIHVSAFERFDENCISSNRHPPSPSRISNDAFFAPLPHPCGKLLSNFAALAIPTLETSSLGAPAPSPSSGVPFKAANYTRSLKINVLACDWRGTRHIATAPDVLPTRSCVYTLKPSPDRRFARIRHFSTSARQLRRRVEPSCPITPH